ncbi:hypothetical protein AB2N04_04045 [Nitratireductor sp. GISD-1A_MAKvit]|uniref:hypothetical protein n=1 Tax=Nitratireductor sp. GISD-1A_MAKvit TaxID=3234198 RepID=UPI0034674D23
MASLQEMRDELKVLIERAREAAEYAEKQSVLDAVAVAAQTHRLDFASVLLSIVGILLAVGGLFAFFEIRYRAKIAAVETARIECRTIAKSLLKGYVNDELPSEVRRLVELIKQESDGEGDDYGEQDTDTVQS